MRKIMKVLVVALLGATLAACGTDATSGQPNEGTPTPSKKAFDETQWTIDTPAGWTREDITKDADADKAIRYKGPNGEYVIVAIDPMGSDYAYDALWRYEIKGDRFEIVDRYTCAGTQDESCSDDDQRFDGYVLWKDGAATPKAGGHTWYFIFGNSQATTVDTGLFEEIIESVRATA